MAIGKGKGLTNSTTLEAINEKGGSAESILKRDHSQSSRMLEMSKKLSLAQMMGPGYYEVKDDVLHK